MAHRACDPFGRVAPPLKADDSRFMIWAQHQHESNSITQMAIIRAVFDDFCNVEPMRSLNNGFILEASKPFDRRGAGTGFYKVGCIVPIKNVYGGTDLGHTHLMETPTCDKLAFVSTACCTEATPAKLQVTATVSGGSPVGDCAVITPQPLTYVDANSRWEGLHPVKAERDAGNNVTLTCNMGIWSINPCPAAGAPVCDPFSISAVACTNVICTATYDLHVTEA